MYIDVTKNYKKYIWNRKLFCEEHHTAPWNTGKVLDKDNNDTKDVEEAYIEQNTSVFRQESVEIDAVSKQLIQKENCLYINQLQISS